MIKNLLFDLGGVIMDIRRENCEEAFRALGMADIGDFLGDYGQTGPFAALEEGAIGESEFRDEVRRHIPHAVTDAEIDSAFNAFLVGIPVKRLEKLRELREKYGIYLLSNTNPIMWDSKIAEEFRKEGKEREDYFDGMVTSFEAKCYKPDRRIFDYVVEHLGIKPEETLFFDDSQANVDAASALGFNACHVAPGTEFYELI
ncbi:MAG: HAD family phosphatase [Lachnospiraceae bacterium]|nr:HAD family phosphatase [Lachnospiraceae bacterium]